MKARDLNRLPVPELIDGKPWDVGEAVGHHAGTNPTAHEMLVPVEGNCDRCGLDHDRYIRCHELTHAKYSKGSITDHAREGGVSSEAYQLAEENFIEAMVVRSYPDLDPPMCETIDGKIHEVRDKIGMAIRNGRPEIAARLAIASASGLSPLPNTFPSGLVEGEKEIYSHLYRFAQTCRNASATRYRESGVIALAKQIESFLGMLDEAAEAERNRDKEDESEKKKTTGKTKAGGVGGTIEKKDTFRKGRTFSRMLQYAAIYTSGAKPQWGKMDLVHPPRPINLNKRFGVRKYRAASEGARVRNISRFYTDQKVFGRKRRYKGGTLLVDISGSMSFSQADLEAIVEQVPATTIAVYAGTYRTGFLRVVAKGGTAAEPRWLGSPGGNEVDGPALDWLGKQREPRIWLSDGGVCVEFDQDGDLYGDASAKCRRYNIRRVRWLEQAKEAFDNPAIGVRSSYPDEDVDIPNPNPDEDEEEEEEEER